MAAVNLAQSIRRYGHLAAHLDPLGSKPPSDPTLLPETHGLTEEALTRIPASLISSPLTANASNMHELVAAFRRVYCSTTGYDYAQVFVPRSGTGCARPPRTAASASPPIQSIRRRSSIG